MPRAKQVLRRVNSEQVVPCALTPSHTRTERRRGEEAMNKAYDSRMDQPLSSPFSSVLVHFLTRDNGPTKRRGETKPETIGEHATRRDATRPRRCCPSSVSPTGGDRCTRIARVYIGSLPPWTTRSRGASVWSGRRRARRSTRNGPITTVRPTRGTKGGEPRRRTTSTSVYMHVTDRACSCRVCP